MPNILHRLTIDAAPEDVQRLVATREGIERWWTGHPVTGEDTAGGRVAVSFRASGEPAAVFAIVRDTPGRIEWRCVEGPSDWVDTHVTYTFAPRDDGGTTLLFSHTGWEQENEFMHNCTTNWAAYLMSLKSGAEGRGFNAYPGGEISRWS